MEDEKNDRKGLLELYRLADGLFLDGKFDEFDKMLSEVDVKSLSTTMIIGWLTMAAQPKYVTGKEMLPSRPDFLKRARAEIELREAGNEKRIYGLLMGLEN